MNLLAILLLAQQQSTPAQPGWVAFVTLIVFFLWLSFLILEIVISVWLLIRVFKLVWKLEAEMAVASEDRKLSREILATIKGWAVIVDQKEGEKTRAIVNAVRTAEKAAKEIERLPARTATAVVEGLRNDPELGSSSGVIKTVPKESEDGTKHD